jgi:hypothetical protein
LHALPTVALQTVGVVPFGEQQLEPLASAVPAGKQSHAPFVQTELQHVEDALHGSPGPPVESAYVIPPSPSSVQLETLSDEAFKHAQVGHCAHSAGRVPFQAQTPSEHA